MVSKRFVFMTMYLSYPLPSFLLNMAKGASFYQESSSLKDKRGYTDEIVVFCDPNTWRGDLRAIATLSR